jgi:hypothetical protein
VTEVLPACCTLFRPRAWAHVPPASIGHGFSTRRLRELWTIPRVHPSPALGWDWIFAVALFHGGGFESVTTPATRMLNCAVPEHYKTIPPGSSYADEFLASNVAGQPVPRVRDQEAWQRVVEVLKADSDCALAAPASLFELAHFSLNFENGWHPRESDAVRWWRWSDGPSAITVSNDSDVSMKIRLAGEIMLPHRNQTVTISNDAATLAVCRAGSHLFDIELQLPPGHLSVRFTPSLPSRWMRRDSHNLAFGVAVRAL